tara:strand:- start:170 stop:817 length:648 start_codon:yes stop_codon:yes gene_type:complete
MSTEDFLNTKKWQLKYKKFGYNPKLIFGIAKTKKQLLFSLSFFLTVMASEILFNQPIRKKIRLIHNKIFSKIFTADFNKVERVELNSFSFSLFMIINKLCKEEDFSKKDFDSLITFSICHWSTISKFNKNEFLMKLEKIKELWETNKEIILSLNDDFKIDLMILLYKSFEYGIGDKEIIKKNIAVLGFSISKVFKEFRYDAISEFKIGLKRVREL